MEDNSDKIQGIRKIRRALVSLYHKEPARDIIKTLHGLGTELVSTGGTGAFIRSMGIPVTMVESLTGYPSILGGRVKTLHPAVFGGILSRSDQENDGLDLQTHNILPVDMVIVDLYPFEKTLASEASLQEIIEKIDIGGISLIRAAAKNYHDVSVVSSIEQLPFVNNLLKQGDGSIGLHDRKALAYQAFDVSSHYDAAIFRYLAEGQSASFKLSLQNSISLRYGENPHQEGRFYGDLSGVFEQLHGKALSYNNLLDVDAAIALISEASRLYGHHEMHSPAGASEGVLKSSEGDNKPEKPSACCFAIIKHTNVCGMAVRENLLSAWTDALAGDPVSAFGGILVTNDLITVDVASAISEIFFEVLIAPGYTSESLALLTQKKNRILLRSKGVFMCGEQYRAVLNGLLWQSADTATTPPDNWTVTTSRKPTETEVEDLSLANIIVKHLKSNAIALVKNRQLCGMGAGQTSRVDALQQSIGKAKAFHHDLKGAVIASDAFFPFSDSVQIAAGEGITAVIQPGGSVRDQESVESCNEAGMTMIFTGRRHFKH